MRVAWRVGLVILAACSSPTPNTGTGLVAYIEPTTLAVHTIDLTTGVDTLLDGSGSAATIALAPMKDFVAYAGSDNAVKIATAAGVVTDLTPGGGSCASTPAWGPNESLAWCVMDGSAGPLSVGLLATPGANGRTVPGSDVVISPDGAQIVFVSTPVGSAANGDLTVETIGGSDARVLASDVADLPVLVTPDEAHVVITEDIEGSDQHLAEIAFADASELDLGSGTAFSLTPDGTEVVIVDGSEIAAASLATGTRRHLATIGGGATVASLILLDADRVLYEANIDTTSGSGATMFLESVHLADATTDKVLVDDPTINETCRPEAVSLAANQVATACGATAIVTFDGTVVATMPAQSVLGFAADDSGIITFASDGAVSFLPQTGLVETLVTGVAASYVP